MGSMNITVNLKSPVCALESGRTGVFRPIRCYLVNISSEHFPPSKFTYEGCRQCLTSRRKGTSCHREAPTTEIYRFLVFLSDGSRDSEPLKATIFNEAYFLLQMSAAEFRRLSDEQQDEMMRKTVMSFPQLLVWITIKQGSLIVSALQRCDNSLPNVSLMSRTQEAGPSSVEKKVSYEDFEHMRRCLADIYEKLHVRHPPAIPADIASCSSGINFSVLSRRELQSLCKEHKLPANKKNSEMAEALRDKLKTIRISYKSYFKQFYFQYKHS